MRPFTCWGSLMKIKSNLQSEWDKNNNPKTPCKSKNPCWPADISHLPDMLLCQAALCPWSRAVGTPDSSGFWFPEENCWRNLLKMHRCGNTTMMWCVFCQLLTREVNPPQTKLTSHPRLSPWLSLKLKHLTPVMPVGSAVYFHLSWPKNCMYSPFWFHHWIKEWTQVLRVNFFSMSWDSLPSSPTRLSLSIAACIQQCTCDCEFKNQILILHFSFYNQSFDCSFTAYWNLLTNLTVNSKIAITTAQK